MKTLSKICQIVALIGAVAALVLFFTNFATVQLSGGQTTDLTGATMAFCGKNALAGAKMARSADIFFCCILTIASVLFGGLGFKFKGSRVAQFIFAGISAVYMLVVSCRAAYWYVDTRPLSGVQSVAYTKLFGIITVLLVSIALFVCTIGSAANILLDDYIKVKESKNGLTIFGKVKRFILDYKSEVKKIVWTGPKAVFKNTVVVIVMCLLIGAFVWLLDLGIGKLIDLILK